MQSIVCFIALVALVAAVSSASVEYSQELVRQNILESLSEANNLNELSRWKRSYGGASVPAPPCPKSFLFSCQSNVAPVPCAPPPAPAYAPAPKPAPAPAPAKPSYAGAYSIPVPTYALPQTAYQGIPRDFVMPAYGYNQYLY